MNEIGVRTYYNDRVIMWVLGWESLFICFSLKTTKPNESVWMYPLWEVFEEASE